MRNYKELCKDTRPVTEADDYKTIDYDLRGELYWKDMKVVGCGELPRYENDAPVPNTGWGVMFLSKWTRDEAVYYLDNMIKWNDEIYKEYENQTKE